MSAERLQAAIRRTKTPVALVLDPREDRLEKKYLKNFTDMYGDCPMAHAEALRYHGSQSISQAAGKLPAVMLRAEPYLRQGFMGMDVLSNLVNMAKNQGLYTIVDARCAGEILDGAVAPGGRERRRRDHPALWRGGELPGSGGQAGYRRAAHQGGRGGLRAESYGRGPAGVSGGRGADGPLRRCLHGRNGL